MGNLHIWLAGDFTYFMLEHVRSIMDMFGYVWDDEWQNAAHIWVETKTTSQIF